MRPGSAESHPPAPVAPVLVLGLGNLLLADDGLGLVLLNAVACAFEAADDRVEFLDGGTQGLALLGRIADRKTLVILDALAMGAEPGTVRVVRYNETPGLNRQRSFTAHESDALDLLSSASLLGQLPDHVVLVGIEPERVETGIGLSTPVRHAIPEALAQAEAILEEAAARGSG